MDHDALVVGGGHNGLICAAYLARAGLDVLVLEARDSVGGCASTVDALGARVNICNCDHVMTRAAPVSEELDLVAHGLRYLDVDPYLLALQWNGGRPWFNFFDPDQTIESLAMSYPSQVEAYRRYLKVALPAARLLIAVTQTMPSRGRIIRKVMERGGSGLATLLRWNRMSASDVLRSFFSEEAVLAPAIAMGPSLWGKSGEAPGTGLGALTFAVRHLVPTGRPVAGSGTLPDSIAAALTTAGGRIRCGAKVAEILVERERVRGVRLTNGETVEAGIVVSAVDPWLAFVTWLHDPPPTANALIEQWRSRGHPRGYQSKIDAVVARVPHYRALEGVDLSGQGVSDPLVPTAVVTQSLGGIEAAHSLLEQGRVAERPLMHVNLPSVRDPSLVVEGSEGGHVLSLEVMFTPYELANSWEGSAEPQRWLDRFGDLVGPHFSESIRRWRVVTPVDYESDFGLPGGYAPSFAGGALAAFLGRQPELTRYRTPIRGLYLTGAGTYPGAGVWGVSGRNAAHVVVGDL